MDILYTIFVTLIALGVLIVVHEWGHFWVARRCGVKVLRFSIGFGKTLFKWTDKQHTEYVLAAIPLGGYVKMLDERNDEVAEEDLSKAFNRQSLLKRIAIVSAGPIANFILACLLYYVLFLGGVSDYRAVIDDVQPNSIAQLAGLSAGDEIVELNNERVESRQWLSRQLLNFYGESNVALKIKTRRVDTSTWSTLSNDSALTSSQSSLASSPSNSQAASNSTEKSNLELDSELLEEHVLNLNWNEDSEQSPLELLGIRLYLPEVSNRLSKVLRNSPAASAGLQEGDVLVELDQQKIDSWQQWSQQIQNHPDKVMNIGVERDGLLVQLSVTPKAVKSGQEYVGQLGVLPTLQEWPSQMLSERHYSVFSAWLPAIHETADKTALTLGMLGKMFVGEVSIKQVGGPISIAQQASISSKLGWQSFVGLIALLSISLGVLNLLPIPVLDGGHLFFYLIEAIKGSPVSERSQTLAFQLGAVLVFGFMIFAIFNDISRL